MALKSLWSRKFMKSKVFLKENTHPINILLSFESCLICFQTQTMKGSLIVMIYTVTTREHCLHINLYIYMYNLKRLIYIILFGQSYHNMDNMEAYLNEFITTLKTMFI